MGDRKAIINSTDMNESEKQDAINFAIKGMEKYSAERDIAKYIKGKFDKHHSPSWHVTVGRKFGSFFTHETGHFIYFYLGQVAILLFKAG